MTTTQQTIGRANAFRKKQTGSDDPSGAARMFLSSLLCLDRQIKAICDIKGQILPRNLVSGPPDMTIRLGPEQ